MRVGNPLYSLIILYFDLMLKKTNVVFTRKMLLLQAGCWLLFYIFLVLYAVQKWGTWSGAFTSTTIGMSSYVLAVYGNALWLMPRFYRTGKKTAYFIVAFLFLAFVIGARMMAEYLILYPMHGKLPFYNLSVAQFTFCTISDFLAFFFGAMLYTTADYITLLRKQETMRMQQAAAELNLLKAQVQPHFLFNTLNNIYYLAYTKSDLAATVIARLSGIMRYFVDEAPKEKVPLTTEINFLKNYMELEQIRMLHAASLRFTHEGVDEMIRIPPMLLIPLVENIYKHGVDKSVPENNVDLCLKMENGYLKFNTVNTVQPDEAGTGSGVGLDNLRKRLTLLFGNDFTLKTEQEGQLYKVELQFPVK